MRRFLFIPFFAAWLASPDAQALPGQTLFNLIIQNGPDEADGTEAGTLYFDLDADVRGGCRYYLVWGHPYKQTDETECWVDEAKTRGHTSCPGNSDAAFNTMIVVDPDLPCWGYDTFAQARPLFMLIGAELAAPSGLVGLIQWTPATPYVSSFETQIYP